MFVVTKIVAAISEKKVVELRADSLQDVTPPDESWAVGSIVWVVKDGTTGKLCGLTSAGEWVEQHPPGETS